MGWVVQFQVIQASIPFGARTEAEPVPQLTILQSEMNDHQASGTRKNGDKGKEVGMAELLLIVTEGRGALMQYT